MVKRHGSALSTNLWFFEFWRRNAAADDCQKVSAKISLAVWARVREVVVVLAALLGAEHVVKVGDVTNGQSQNLNFRQLFVRWQRGQELSKVQKGRIEGLNPKPFPNQSCQ